MEKVAVEFTKLIQLYDSARQSVENTSGMAQNHLLIISDNLIDEATLSMFERILEYIPNSYDSLTYLIKSRVEF